MNPPTTNFCLLTPPGRAAIATIGVWGPEATALVSRLFRPASGRPLTAFPIGHTVFGRFETAATTSEDLIVGLAAADEVEIHCHGGRAAVEAICEALLAASAAQITPSAWTHRQESDSIAAEALLAMADARTERTAAILLDQYRGALRREITAIDSALAKNETAAAADGLHQLLDRAAFGLHLMTPWKVVLAGRPNAGKSSLMNAIVGYERAIVFHEPGTTRDVLTAATAIDGWPIELSDTAGLRFGQAVPAASALNPIESEGIARAHGQVASADLVVLVADTTGPWDDPLLLEIRRAAGRPPLVVHNKCDLAAPPPDRPTGIQTSAVAAHGIDKLCQAIASALVPAAPPHDTAVPFTARHITALELAAQHIGLGQLSSVRQQLAALLQEFSKQGIHVGSEW